MFKSTGNLYVVVEQLDKEIFEEGWVVSFLTAVISINYKELFLTNFETVFGFISSLLENSTIINVKKLFAEIENGLAFLCLNQELKAAI